MTDKRFKELWEYAKKRERLDEGAALLEALDALVEEQAMRRHIESMTGDHYTNEPDIIAARRRELGL